MQDNKEKPELPSEELLVAYLDGELDERAAADIEEQLATDPELRRRLDSLSGAWAMLDELEQPAVDHNFTESTLEIVALAAESEAGGQRAASTGRKMRRALTFAGGILSVGLLGFLCAAIARPDPNRLLLDDLPVVERLDEYRQIDDIDFLRELHKSGLFSEDAPDD